MRDDSNHHAPPAARHSCCVRSLQFYFTPLDATRHGTLVNSLQRIMIVYLHACFVWYSNRRCDAGHPDNNLPFPELHPSTYTVNVVEEITRSIARLIAAHCRVVVGDLPQVTRFGFCYNCTKSCTYFRIWHYCALRMRIRSRMLRLYGSFLLCF